MIATVMPHALFLGSSLAAIDRLDMIPQPPTHPSDNKSKRSFKMPTLGLVRRLKGISTRTNVEEETIEMDTTPVDHLAISPAQAEGGDPDSKPDVLPQITRKETNYESEMRKYESDLKSFDRIRWTDLHIHHATVSYPIFS
jgi:metal iron transporter